MTNPKTTIVVLADPGGGEDALGRVFNALAAAYDYKQRKADVQLVFQGAGTRWSAILTMPDHPVHALYKAVEDKVIGVSSGCADFFDARDGADNSGMSMIADNRVPGTSGLPSLAAYAAEGPVITF